MGTILTNKYNLPDTIVEATKADSHKVAGDISVTQLLDSPRIRILKKKNNVVEDVSDRLWMLMGTALHHILERANIQDVRKRAFLLVVDTLIEKSKGNETYKKVAKYLQDLIPVFFPEIGSKYIFEVTLSTEIDGTIVYGTFDIYDKIKKKLYDYKFCSVYNWIFPEARKKWTRQTNLYCFLLKKEGYEVNEISIIAFFRDWSENGILKNKDYPEKQIKEIPIQIYPQDKVEDFVKNRLKIHKDAEEGDLPLCTGEERWASADEWIVRKESIQRAMRKYESEREAVQFVAENSHKYKDIIIEKRPGDSRRCDKYCSVVAVCEQRKKELFQK